MSAGLQNDKDAPGLGFETWSFAPHYGNVIRAFCDLEFHRTVSIALTQFGWTS